MAAFSENPPHFSRHIFITYGIHYQSQSERTKVTMRILKIQKDKSEALLFRMLPYSVVKELRKCRENNSLYVGSYQSATVLFADLADFQVY